jgi:hypothetical protein
LSMFRESLKTVFVIIYLDMFYHADVST